MKNALVCKHISNSLLNFVGFAVIRKSLLSIEKAWVDMESTIINSRKYYALWLLFVVYYVMFTNYLTTLFSMVHFCLISVFRVSEWYIYLMLIMVRLFS